MIQSLHASFNSCSFVTNIYVFLQFYIHSYLEVLHATMENPWLIGKSQELEINYRMQETDASASLRFLSPSQRKCRFDDEPLDATSKHYSISICYMSCRHSLVMKLCNCRPFFYHNLSIYVHTYN